MRSIRLSPRFTSLHFAARFGWLVLASGTACDDGTRSPAGASGGTTSGGSAAITGGSGGSGALPGTGGSTTGATECGAPDASLAKRERSELFESDHVPVFDLVLPPDAWSELKRTARDEKYVEAKACYEGRAVGNVGLRFKGSYGTLLNCFDAAGNQKCPKLSMKVKFDKYTADQRFFGMKVLNFHSMIWDPSHLRERIGYRLFRDMGVVAPQSFFATLRVNGETQGLFSMVEEVDGRFTDDRFPKNGDGDLYKEAWPTSTDPEYYADHLETNEETATHEVPLSLGAALNQASSAAEARSKLAEFVDLPNLYRYMAVDDAILNVDGVTAVYTDENSSYALIHNFYLYKEETRPQLWFIPWDLDSTFEFGTFGAVPHWTEKPADCSLHYPVWNGGGIVYAPGCNILFQALASDLTEYRSAVQELLDGPLAEKPLLERIDQQAELIRAAAESDPHGPSPETFEAAHQHLKTRIPLIRGRMQSLMEGRQPVPFAFEPRALNDFENVEEFELLLGATLMFNQNSRVTYTLNRTDPLAGARDLRLEFSYRNETKPWDQWIYFSIPFRGAQIDANALTGVRLRVRADRARTLRLDLESPRQTGTSAGVRFGWDIPVSDQSRLVEVHFADAKVQSWAVDQGLDPHDDPHEVLGTMIGLALNPSCEGRNSAGFLPEGSSDDGQIELDDLELF
ncbi:MAG TPA: CotH kinase family protein [Polyangiaceae bacterium]|nr:CotH kinase family protein [Polyangiaceae bacterium]